MSEGDGIQADRRESFFRKSTRGAKALHEIEAKLGPILTHAEKIRKRRGAFKWLPVFFSNSQPV
jgi:hypothetical protein